MKKLFLTIICILAMASMAWAADKTMSWDAASGTDGYKIYKSEDLGASWDVGIDVGNVTIYVYTGIIVTPTNNPESVTDKLRHMLVI